MDELFDGFLEGSVPAYGEDFPADQEGKRPVTKTAYHAMTHAHANPNGQIHGGEIMKRMDTLAGIAARDYAESAVATASVDTVAFYEPVDIGDTLYLEARIEYVGTTSMMVHVDVAVEDAIEQERHHTTDAYYTFVALDADHEPRAVPDLRVETEEEQARYETAREVKDRLASR